MQKYVKKCTWESQKDYRIEKKEKGGLKIMNNRVIAFSGKL